MHFRNVNSLTSEFYKIGDVAAPKRISEIAAPAVWHRLLKDWHEALIKGFGDVVDLETESTNYPQLIKIKENIKYNVNDIINDLLTDFKELNLKPFGEISQQAIDEIDDIFEKIENQEFLSWGEVLKAVYYSLYDFLERLDRYRYPIIPFFEIDEKLKIKPTKSGPNILKDIWIGGGIYYQNLINFMLAEDTEVGSLIISKNEELFYKKGVNQKYFKGLFQACTEAQLIEKVKSGDLFSKILANTFNYNRFQSKYYQDLGKPIETHMDYDYFAMFENIKDQIAPYK